MVALADVRLRASWSQGFKTPTPKELHYRYIRDMNGTYLYLGNTGLKPQTSNYFSLGAEYTRKGFSLTATAYYNKVDDMIALVTIPNRQAPIDLYTQYQPLKTRQYQNLEQAETRGVDLTLRYRLSAEWNMGAAYSYLDTDAEVYDTEKEQLRSVVIDGMAHHKANWFVTWSHELRGKKSLKSREGTAPTLGFGLYGRLSSKRYYQINGNGKGYQIWRATARYTFTPHLSPLTLQLEAGVDNILNYCDRTPHGLHLGTTTPGRTVYASLTVRFNKGKKLSNNYKSNFNNYSNNEQD